MRTLGIILVLLTAAFPALAQEAAPAPNVAITATEDGFGHLASYVGTYDYQAVLSDPKVKANLDALLGPDSTSLLATNLGVSPPIRAVGPYLVLKGNAPHEGGSEAAVLWINQQNGQMLAGILHSGSITLYSTPEMDRKTLNPDFVKDVWGLSASVPQAELPKNALWASPLPTAGSQ